jgi:hypothetical protein
LIAYKNNIDGAETLDITETRGLIALKQMEEGHKEAKEQRNKVLDEQLYLQV